MLGGDSLHQLYQTNFALMQVHKYSLSEIENMIPFERELYTRMLNAHVEKENQRVAEQQKQQELQIQKLNQKRKKNAGRQPR